MNNQTVVDRPCHAILIKAATSRASVVVAVAMVVLFSITIGLVTGFLAKDVKIGLAVCAGAIGILALVQASMVGVDAMRWKAKC